MQLFAGLCIHVGLLKRCSHAKEGIGSFWGCYLIQYHDNHKEMCRWHLVEKKYQFVEKLVYRHLSTIDNIKGFVINIQGQHAEQIKFIKAKEHNYPDSDSEWIMFDSCGYYNTYRFVKDDQGKLRFINPTFRQIRTNYGVIMEQA